MTRTTAQSRALWLRQEAKREHEAMRMDNYLADRHAKNAHLHYRREQELLAEADALEADVGKEAA